MQRCIFREILFNFQPKGTQLYMMPLRILKGMLPRVLHILNSQTNLSLYNRIHNRARVLISLDCYDFNSTFLLSFIFKFTLNWEYQSSSQESDDHFSKHFKVRQKYSAGRHKKKNEVYISILNSILDVWKCGKTHSLVIISKYQLKLIRTASFPRVGTEEGILFRTSTQLSVPSCGNIPRPVIFWSS